MSNPGNYYTEGGGHYEEGGSSSSSRSPDPYRRAIQQAMTVSGGNQRSKGVNVQNTPSEAGGGKGGNGGGNTFNAPGSQNSGNDKSQDGSMESGGGRGKGRKGGGENRSPQDGNDDLKDAVSGWSEGPDGGRGRSAKTHALPAGEGDSSPENLSGADGFPKSCVRSGNKATTTATAPATPTPAAFLPSRAPKSFSRLGRFRN